ncbi:hypothetical protein [Micromonospora inositola]|uniref:hypothetical protein n=1 Tax=Micromonospora inositola TaxID=47865 RepID=UPI0012FD22C3|nr:hypothetical protein [Micromonospora inositola]
MASQVMVKPLPHAEVSDVVQIDARRVGGVNEVAAACCSPLPATYRSAHLRRASGCAGASRACATFRRRGGDGDGHYVAPTAPECSAGIISEALDRFRDPYDAAWR